MSSKSQRAIITRTGKPGHSEPYARLEDGREMPMGWSMGKTFSVGQLGTAEYIRTGSAMLWKFNPDDENKDKVA